MVLRLQRPTAEQHFSMTRLERRHKSDSKDLAPSFHRSAVFVSSWTSWKNLVMIPMMMFTITKNTMATYMEK